MNVVINSEFRNNNTLSRRKHQRMKQQQNRAPRKAVYILDQQRVKDTEEISQQWMAKSRSSYLFIYSGNVPKDNPKI
jgi:hypothetical protein